MKFEAAPFNYESVLKTQMTQVCRYQEPLLALASGLAAGKGADAASKFIFLFWIFYSDYLVAFNS